MNLNFYNIGTIFFLNFLLFFNALAETISPSKTITPFDAIKIQLVALQNNNLPYKDAGIEQTWLFAHPRNQKMTGPYLRFKEMLYDENYVILINHISHEIKLIKEKENMNVYAVSILSEHKRNYVYIWIVQKVTHGQLLDCWLTTSVSFPKYEGDSI